MKTLFTRLEMACMWKHTAVSALPKWVNADPINFFIGRSRQELFVQMNSQNKTGFLFEPSAVTARSDEGYRHMWKNDAQNPWTSVYSIQKGAPRIRRVPNDIQISNHNPKTQIKTKNQNIHAKKRARPNLYSKPTGKSPKRAHLGYSIRLKMQVQSDAQISWSKVHSKQGGPTRPKKFFDVQISNLKFQKQSPDIQAKKSILKRRTEIRWSRKDR